MEPFSCNRCGTGFVRKDYLQKHLERKRVCKPIIMDVDVKLQHVSLQTEHKEKRNYNSETNTYDCNYCDKQFDTSAKKHAHVHICQKIQKIEREREKEMREMREKIDLSDRVNHELNQKLEKIQLLLENSVQLATNTTTNTTINTVNNINNNNINITITNFGSEPVNFSDEFMERCLYLCQDDANLDVGAQNGITTLLKELHSPPANRNVRIKNLNQSLLLIHKDGKWLLESKKNVLEAMFIKGKVIMSKYKAKNKDRLCDEEPFAGMFEEIEEWLSTFDDEDAPKYREKREKIKGEVFRNIVSSEMDRKELTH